MFKILLTTLLREFFLSHRRLHFPQCSGLRTEESDIGPDSACASECMQASSPHFPPANKMRKEQRQRRPTGNRASHLSKLNSLDCLFFHSCPKRLDDDALPPLTFLNIPCFHLCLYVSWIPPSFWYSKLKLRNILVFNLNILVVHSDFSAELRTVVCTKYCTF